MITDLFRAKQYKPKYVTEEEERREITKPRTLGIFTYIAIGVVLFFALLWFGLLPDFVNGGSLAFDTEILLNMIIDNALVVGVGGIWFWVLINAEDDEEGDEE